MALAALAMLVVFVLAMLSSVLPAKLSDVSWQLAMVAALVDNAVIPLVALLILHVAARLNPRDGFSAALRDRAACWAVLAALGFALLVPLQLWNGWRLQQADLQALVRQERQADSRFQQLRGAVAEASSPADLQGRLRQLVGPDLERFDPTTPLPQLRQQLNRILDRNQRLLRQQLQRQRQQRAERRGGGGLIPGPLRGALSCLAYALAFAALARRPRASVSLLAELLFTTLGSGARPPRWRDGSGLVPSPRELREEELVP